MHFEIRRKENYLDAGEEGLSLLPNARPHRKIRLREGNAVS
jgi:hypothetical protein